MTVIECAFVGQARQLGCDSSCNHQHAACVPHNVPAARLGLKLSTALPPDHSTRLVVNGFALCSDRLYLAVLLLIHGQWRMPYGCIPCMPCSFSGCRSPHAAVDKMSWYLRQQHRGQQHRLAYDYEFHHQQSINTAALSTECTNSCWHHLLVRPNAFQPIAASTRQCYVRGGSRSQLGLNLSPPLHAAQPGRYQLAATGSSCPIKQEVRHMPAALYGMHDATQHYCQHEHNGPSCCCAM
jgi:hypothetical protein